MEVFPLELEWGGSAHHHLQRRHSFCRTFPGVVEQGTSCAQNAVALVIFDPSGVSGRGPNFQSKSMNLESAS
ncbi:hypothetical protein SADUNF_Sadunf19G0046700 [Salix dunnii]|uniref:Uncharacterized protein n=1 Tax=Salix dunnii TaxID=1413687 RepID=A0A835J182_9ROSI|nr:hypothetical protein SADUNF_Sadunf19G0046700 [Salix dunnii]